MPEQVGGIPNQSLNPSRSQPAGPTGTGPSNTASTQFQRSLTLANALQSAQTASQAAQTPSGPTSQTPSILFQDVGFHPAITALQAGDETPPADQGQRTAQGPQQPGQSPQPAQTQSSPLPGQSVLALNVGGQGGGQQQGKRRGPNQDKTTGVEEGDKSATTEETSTLETPEGTPAVVVETAAIDAREDTSPVAAEATWTPEKLASLTRLEIFKLRPQLLASGIDAAKVEAAELRAYARELKVAAHKLAVKAEALHATALPEIRRLIDAGDHGGARGEIDKLIAQGMENIEEVYGHDPITAATVRQRYRATVENAGLRTESAAVLLPRLEAGAALVKQNREKLERDPEIAQALGLPAPPSWAQSMGAMLWNTLGSYIPSPVRAQTTGVQSAPRSMGARLWDTVGSYIPSPVGAQTTGVQSSSAPRAADLSGVPPQWAGPMGAMFRDKFGSYIREDKQDPALFDKVRSLDSDAFLAALNSSDYARGYVRDGGQLADLQGLPSFAEMNPNGSVKAIYVRQAPGADVTGVQAAAVQRAVLTLMHPTFKTTFTSDTGRAGVVSFIASQHPHPSTNASTWSPAQGVGAQMASQVHARLDDPADLFRAYFGGTTAPDAMRNFTAKLYEAIG